MHVLGEYKYPDSYIRKTGVIAANKNSQFLKPEYQPEAKPVKKHEVFFNTKNPGYAKGDELVCLTKLSMENINPFIKRLISKYL
jgi:hypothetical protein